jgi:DNA replication and repair protein RecF
MYIKNIIIKNFRNINYCNIDFHKKLNVIIGDNAQGKTNIIESIYYSNFYKSFRTKNNKNLIKIEQNNFNIEINLKHKNVSNNLKLSLDNKNNRRILLNNKKPETIGLYNIVNTIVYYPSEVNLLMIYPSYRRNLIDRSIFFIENEYINTIKKYNKILKQRNSYLKKHIDDFDPWVDQIFDISEEIITKRIDYIDRINNKFNELYDGDNLKEKYFIKYKNYKKDSIQTELRNSYINVKDKEKKYGYTLFGPHIDDYSFFINNNNIKNYSSEGQKKYLLLNFKYAQLLDYVDIYDDYPIILYDDYSSELDVDRQKLYFEKIYEKSGQLFITSTKSLNNMHSDCKLMNVQDGVISDFLF